MSRESESQESQNLALKDRGDFEQQRQYAVHGSTYQIPMAAQKCWLLGQVMSLEVAILLRIVSFQISSDQLYQAKT
jgi:hypothetical protein